MNKKWKGFINNKKLSIPICIVLVLCVGYLVLCLIAGNGDFISNATINGIDVGNKTVEEAKTLVNEQYLKDIENLKMDVEVKEQHYSMDLTNNVTASIDEVVEKIANDSGSIFTRGIAYLSNHDYVVPVTIKDDNQLIETIKATKVLDYDTSQKTTYELKDNQIVFTKGNPGERVIQEDLIETIKKALSEYNFKNTVSYTPKDLSQDDTEMELMHTELCKEASNATIDTKNNDAIIPAVVGISYDLEKAKSAYNGVNVGETFSVDATIKQPTVTTEDLQKNLFRDVLGTYTTTVSGSSVRKNNVRLAGIKCNKTMLAGEIFDYNTTVGKRTKANGFGEAGAYVNGESVDVIGGGICQASSTLYNAVMLSNLEVVQRQPHSYVSGYVPIGRDATVSWGGPEFKFKNNSDYPIKIVVSYKNSRLTAKILGTNVDGITVKLRSTKLSSTPYKTIYKDDPTLEVGKTKTSVSGYSGATAQSYRDVYDKNGKLISSTKEAYSVYKKRDKVVLRGTKPVTTTTPSTTTPTDTTTPSTDTTTPVQ